MTKDKTLTRENHPEWFNYDAYVRQLNGFPSKETYAPKYILYTQDKPIDKLTDEEKSEICKKGEPAVHKTAFSRDYMRHLRPATPTD